MRICIPIADDGGLDSRLHDHFGSAPFFALADTDSGAVEVVRNTGNHGGHGRCRPIAQVDVDRTDAVVCQGMGKRALASVREEGLEVWITSAHTVRNAIAEAYAGKLERLSAHTACGGHATRAHGHGRGATPPRNTRKETFK
jgi:predicted Fe-Mo cluster-binding NifX family protein